MRERPDRIEAVGSRKRAADAYAAIGGSYPDETEPTGRPADRHAGVCTQPAQADPRGNRHARAPRRPAWPVTDVPRVGRSAVEFIEPSDACGELVHIGFP